MSNLMQASAQWASRPADERFWNLAEMGEHLNAVRANSFETESKLGEMRAVNVGGEICLQGAKGIPSRLNNWSFGQLANLVGAPAGYLQTLPVELACCNLQYGLSKVDKEQNSKLLLHRNGVWTVRAMTSATYGRIWNADVVRSLQPVLDRGWMTPPARPNRDDDRARPATENDILPNQDDFGLSVKVGDMIAPAGCYAGDRDCFVFLVNPSRIIDDGSAGLMRGVFISNSEVGSAAFHVKTFYLENVCGNHICWGASNVKDFRIIHKKNAVVGFDSRTLRALQVYSDGSAIEEESMIRNARSMVLGANKAEVVDTLFSRRNLQLSKNVLEGAFEMAAKWEHTALAAPVTVWGFVHGLTRYSQNTLYAEARNAIDRAAGKILDLAV